MQIGRRRLAAEEDDRDATEMDWSASCGREGPRKGTTKNGRYTSESKINSP